MQHRETIRPLSFENVAEFRKRLDGTFVLNHDVRCKRLKGPILYN